MTAAAQQLDLIDRPGTSRAAARQAAMSDARARADLGMDRAARRVARLHAHWCELAVEALRKFARNQAGRWSIEEARVVLEQELPPVDEKRVWGRVVQDAARLGYIEKTGKSAPTASSNASIKPLWRRGRNA